MNTFPTDTLNAPDNVAPNLVPSLRRALLAWREDRVLMWLILGSIVLGLIYNFVILLGYGPDEPRHMAYVKLLATEQRLPFLLPNGREYGGAHSLHPPLYYACLVPLYWLMHSWAGAAFWHVARAFSAVLCAASLLLFYDIALTTSGRRDVARLTVAHLGWLPIFGMTAGVINNDAASILAVALFAWLLIVRFETRLNVRRAVALGVCLGLGSLCKAPVVIADVAMLLGVLLARNDGPRLKNLGYSALAGMVAALVGGAWYARSFALYGQFSPIETGYTNAGLPNPSQGVLVMMMHDHFPPLFAYANWGLFYSSWSQKDWFPESLRAPIYFSLLAYCALAIVGSVIGARRKIDASLGATNEQKAARWSLFGAFGLTWAACLWMALFKHWGWAEGGRYLLASSGGAALFLALGWRQLLGEIAYGRWLWAWCAWTLCLNVVAIYWLLKYLNPTFGSS